MHPKQPPQHSHELIRLCRRAIRTIGVPAVAIEAGKKGPRWERPLADVGDNRLFPPAVTLGLNRGWPQIKVLSLPPAKQELPMKFICPTCEGSAAAQISR